MEFQITGQNIEITSALRETVEKNAKNWSNSSTVLMVSK